MLNIKVNNLKNMRRNLEFNFKMIFSSKHQCLNGFISILKLSSFITKTVIIEFLSRGNGRNPPDELESDSLSVQVYILYVFRIIDI
jgi:hypothetical protein